MFEALLLIGRKRIIDGRLMAAASNVSNESSAGPPSDLRPSVPRDALGCTLRHPHSLPSDRVGPKRANGARPLFHLHYMYIHPWLLRGLHECWEMLRLMSWV